MKRLFLITILFVLACSQDQKPVTGISHPDWSRNKVIYELNVRQFSASGTFKAVELRLASIKDLGVGIIWLMPVQPIGEKNRKGVLGSYYSVKDYLKINPEFGTMEDFKKLVNRIPFLARLSMFGV